MTDELRPCPNCHGWLEDGHQCYGGSTSAEIKDRLTSVSTTGSVEGKLGHLSGKVLHNVENRWQATKEGLPASRISSGIRLLDIGMGGLWPRNVTIIGGRPGTCKTATMCHMAIGAAKSGAHTEILSLEMDSESLCERLVANLESLDITHMKIGLLSDEKEEEYKDKIQVGMDRLDKMPIWIYDKNADINTTIEHMYMSWKRNKINVFFIDYIQRIGPSRDETGMDRHEQIDNACKKFKEFAKATDTAVIVLSQVNRGSEQTSDRRPEAHMLKGSGGIEQEADSIILLHREKLPNGRGLSEDLELLLVKARNGETTRIDMVYVGKYSRLEEPRPDF